MKIKLTPNQFHEELYDITVFVDTMPNVSMEPIHHEDGCTYWYGENDDGFVRFGISHDERDAFGHEPGYMWSSRASVFNGRFPSECFCKEVTIAVNENGHICRYHGFALNTEVIIEALTLEHQVAVYHNADDFETWVEVCDMGKCPKDIELRGTLVDTFVRCPRDGDTVASKRGRPNVPFKVTAIYFADEDGVVLIDDTAEAEWKLMRRALGCDASVDEYNRTYRDFNFHGLWIYNGEDRTYTYWEVK